MTFKRARIGFVVSVVLLALLRQFQPFSPWWFVVPLVIYEGLQVYGASIIRSDFFTKAHCGADTLLKEISITFDDGPHPEFTPRVLSTLADFNAPAAFFLIGSKIQGNEDILRRMDAAGHEIGNHSYTHSYFIDFKRCAGFMDELNRTADAIFKVINKRVKFFRPPFGVTTPQVALASEALSYDVIGWNVRSLDTSINDEDRLAERVREQIRPGSVILFHDTSDKTVRVLERTLRYARENGYKVVSLERLLRLKPYV